ncbi:MAG: YncE family protein [Janthinobacterium lividum]
MTDRLLLLNIGTPSRLLSISPEGDDMQVLIADLGVAPDGIAVDPLRRHIFWTYMGNSHDGEVFNVNDGSIHRVDYDGGNHAVIIPEGGTFTPKQIKCDAANGLIYWCDREGMRVMRARIDGSNPTVLVQTGSTDEDRADPRRHCVGVAVDPRGGFLYWTQKGKPNGGEGRILRASLDSPVDPSARDDIELLFDRLPEPIDLDWEPETGSLYWTDRGDPPTGNTLNRARIQPGQPVVREILLTGVHEAIGLTIDQAHRRAFVSDLGGFVRVVALDHPGDERIIFSGHGPLTGIAYLAA